MSSRPYVVHQSPKYSILNCVIDQELRQKQYENQTSPKEIIGFYPIPETFLKTLNTLKERKTPDPYIALGLATGFITQAEIDSGKVSEIKWSMKKILQNFGLQPDQKLLTAPNCNFRENKYKIGTLSGYLYNKLSSKENPKTMLFEFKRVCEQLNHHNYVLQIAVGVAKRYIKEYDISEVNTREGVVNYDTYSPVKTSKNRNKVNASINYPKKKEDRAKYETKNVDNIDGVLGID